MFKYETEAVVAGDLDSPLPLPASCKWMQVGCRDLRQVRQRGTRLHFPVALLDLLRALCTVSLYQGAVTGKAFSSFLVLNVISTYKVFNFVYLKGKYFHLKNQDYCSLLLPILFEHLLYFKIWYSVGEPLYLSGHTN